MKIDCENDWGAFDTLFRMFNGYNIRLTVAEPIAALGGRLVGEAQISGLDSQDDKSGVVFRAWTREDNDESRAEPTGPDFFVPYDAIEEIVIV